MAKTIKKEPADKKTDAGTESKKSWRITKQHKALVGSLLVLFAISLLLAFVSFYIYGQEDQSAVTELADRDAKVGNWLGKFGAFLADIFVYKGFGAASFLFVRLFFLTGAYLVLDLSVKNCAIPGFGICTLL
ncbi:DNA translocase FtsK 4TM domain-containing protein [Flavobacterium sp. 3HN19-14]|uniref:DNA translocase FtsK 4TM domain-containing protein n=1 Tax=Flavobacterium sp. 3HN19-14 TaxID=3448133 RepID=UPI003EE078AC